MIRRHIARWAADTRWVRPVEFDMFPPPVRGTALQVVRQYVEELIARGSVDGATGDALDELIDAWLAQWRQELQPGLAARQALLQYLRNLATARVAAAQGRADATRHAYETAYAAYAATCANVRPAVTHWRSHKELTNGVHVPDPP